MNRFFTLFFFTLAGSFSTLFARDFFYMGAYEDVIMPNDPYRPPKPLMWNANLKVSRSVTAGFEHRIYAYKQWMEIYSGVSGNYMEAMGAVEKDQIGALSTYLMMRLYLFQTDAVKLYALYSPAGPTVLTEKKFATTEFSNQFVFQNQIGFGLSIGKDAETELFVKLYHYSNGDLFPVNGGIDVPILFGFSFVL